MIELDGIQYNVRTPQENAEDMLTFINNYCIENNITNTKGELVRIAQNWANPLYMIVYGFSYLASIMQKLIYNVGCSLNIARASDRQLMNIAAIANVKRKAATKTTISCTIFASLSSDDDPQACHITKDLVITTTYGNNTITFSPAYETTVPIGSSTNMILVCNEEGSYSIPENSLTSFDDPVVGFRRMSTQASVPGQAEESLADLRSRIQERATTSTQLDRAAADITQLDGVTLCNIYFNYSNTSSTMVGTISVPPRQALLFVQGYSDDIARIFYNHLSCLTAGGDSPSSLRQIYTTHAGQELPVYVIQPEVVYPHLVIHLGGQVISEVNLGIKDAIATLCESQKIGQSLTSTAVIAKIREYYPSLDLRGVEMSFQSDGPWSYQVSVPAYQLIGFNIEYMLLDEPQS